MIVNERGEWESESDPEEEGPRYDEEICGGTPDLIRINHARHPIWH